ncbi:MAG: hypothetical protein ACRC33_14975 [Gemmataceae bacterium]
MTPSSPLRQPPCRITLGRGPVERALDLGVIGLSCWITLWLDTEGGVILPVTFLVDSGASYPLMNLDEAASRGLRVPPVEAECELPLLTAHGRATSRVRPGRVRGWWHPDCAGHPFAFPMLFRVNAASTAPRLLGLGGVVRLCRWTFDGRPTAAEPYGTLALDDTR